MKREIPLILSIVGLFGSLIQAQEESNDDVYELSPFVVAPQSGYLATETLSGTRIRTSLKDVGAAIQVATAEFMRDINATNADELLVYTTNTEVSGIGGNFAGAENVEGGQAFIAAGSTRQGSPSTRIRGLEQADLAREYFLSDIPFDSYNTDQIEVNRGPNAVLFGLGSPAGIINAGLAKAIFNDQTEVEARFGSHDSTRGSIDINRVLVEDELAARIIGLYDDQKFQQSPGFDRDRRLYSALTWRRDFAQGSEAWGTTTVRASAELAEIEANRPHITPPGDTITRWWTESNQGTVPHTVDWRDTDRNLFSIPGDWIFMFGAVYSDHRSEEPSLGFNDLDGFVPLTPANLRDDRFFMGFRGLSTFQDHVAGRAGSGETLPASEFYQDKLLTDRSVFDYRENMLFGPLKREFEDFEAYNATIDQQLLDGAAGFQLAFDKQRYFEGNFNPFNEDPDGYTLQIDVNPNLPSGDPNPNFGRPFVAAGKSAEEDESRRTAYRLTGFYDFDFKEHIEGRLGSILGRHTITGLYATQRIDQFDVNFLGAGSSQEFLARMGRSNVLANQFGRVASVHYLGPSLASASSAAGANVPRIEAMQVVPNFVERAYFWDPAQQAWTVEPLTLRNYRDDRGLVRGAGKNREDIDSYASILQSRLLEGHVVTTIGWKRDEQEIFTAPDPRRNPVDNTRDLSDPAFVLPSLASARSAAEIWTWSAVLHAPQGFVDRMPIISDLSVHYNEAENFQPSAERFDALGNVIPSPNGITQDVGFSVSLFENKLYARINFYESSQNNVSASGVPINPWMWFGGGIVEANSRGFNDGNPEKDNFEPAPQELLDFWGYTEVVNPDGSIDVEFNAPGPVAAVTNRVSEGIEIELTYNPTENWRIHFNAAQAEAVQSGLDPAVVSIIEMRQPIWDRTGSLFVGSFTNFTFAEALKTDILNPMAKARAQDGSPIRELREWRWNLVTNYDFRGTAMPALKGFGVGAALRWQDEVAIGPRFFLDDETGDFLPDVSDPFLADSELNGDVWVSYERKIANDSIDWSVQLNVRNLVGGDDDYLPISAQPDGSIASVRIPEDTTWELSTRFSF